MCLKKWLIEVCYQKCGDQRAETTKFLSEAISLNSLQYDVLILPKG